MWRGGDVGLATGTERSRAWQSGAVSTRASKPIDAETSDVRRRASEHPSNFADSTPVHEQRPISRPGRSPIFHSPAFHHCSGSTPSRQSRAEPDAGPGHRLGVSLGIEAERAGPDALT